MVFALRKACRPLFVTSNRCIPVKIQWAEVQSYMCVSDNSVIAVVFCVVSVVPTFDSRLVINEIPIKWRPVCF
jgi:hypothetical protein